MPQHLLLELADGVTATLLAGPDVVTDSLREHAAALRLRAALILGRLGSEDDAVITVLGTAVSTDPFDGLIRLRLGAAEFLGGLGAAARRVLPGLTAALATLRHWELRRVVRMAVARIQEEA